MKLRGQKVFVGMSGGVDSSVSAALLKEAGYQVTGVFIKTWSPDWLPCTWREERRDAMRVAAKLKIPLLTLDLEKEYKEAVVDYMIAEYRVGRVPNPDVMCNKVIKFGGFFDFAMRQGADFVATGHYARRYFELEKGISQSSPKTSSRRVDGLGLRRSQQPESADSWPPQEGTNYRLSEEKLWRSLLASGLDKEKDQTYFLWTLTQRELSRTLFPVGDLQKSEVRKLAKKFDLPNAEKKDSQGLCFMGKIDVKEFLKHYIKEKSGKVLNESGKVIGEHEGATFYTMGERHGFKITTKGINDFPYYVVAKDIKKNTLTVSNKKDGERDLKKEIMIKNVNWNQGLVPDLTKKYSARIRYRQELQSCKMTKISKDNYKIIFANSQGAVASGQSTVIYHDDVCLGGGIIV